jgi:hypothetical protein
MKVERWVISSTGNQLRLLLDSIVADEVRVFGIEAHAAGATKPFYRRRIPPVTRPCEIEVKRGEVMVTDHCDLATFR